MPSNTVFDPKNSDDFDKQKMNFNSQGVMATCTLNTTTNIDLDFTDDHLVTGFWVIGDNITSGDKVDMQIIDPTNIFGFGANAVLKQFCTDIYLPTGSFHEQFDVVYPAKIITGLRLRVIYHSTLVIGLQPIFKVNYKLHKVLV